MKGPVETVYRTQIFLLAMLSNNWTVTTSRKHVQMLRTTIEWMTGSSRMDSGKKSAASSSTVAQSESSDSIEVRITKNLSSLNTYLLISLCNIR